MAFVYLAVSAVVVLSQATPAPAPPARAARPAPPAVAVPLSVDVDVRAALEAAQASLRSVDVQAALEIAQAGIQDRRADIEMAQLALEEVLARAPVVYGDNDQDPADSLYRQARELLNRNRYTQAAAKFKEFRTKSPYSDRVADALYFEAFALYRGGDINQLREAKARLEEQEKRFPQAATKSDTKTLRVRIYQELAQRGDRAAAESLAVWAKAAAPSTSSSSSSSSSSGRTPRPPRPPTPPKPPKPPRHGEERSSCASGEEDDVKMTALNAIMQMDSERAVPILKAVLAKRDTGSVCLRRRAVFIVSQHKSPEVTAILLDAARRDPDLDVRLNAVQWLSQVRSDEATAALDSILRSSRDVEIQEKAIFALSQSKSVRAGASLRAYAERSDVPVAVRENAIFWLGQQRSPENAAFLRSLYGKLQNTELKERCLFSLSQMPEEGNDRWLLDLAANERETIDIRKRALFYAGQAGAPMRDLAAVYDRTKDREMKEQLIFVYSQHKDSAAVTKLIDIARKETDPELRKKAVFWLGQSRDPRAEKYLVELINQP